MTTPHHKPTRSSSTTQNADIPDSESTDQAPDAGRALDDWERWLAEGSVEMAEFGGDEHTDLAIDDDGRHVRLRGRLLSGGRETAAGSREWQDGPVRYYCVSDGGRTHLLIIAGRASLLIENWRDGALGIRLIDLHHPNAARTDKHPTRELRGAAHAPMRCTPRQRPPRKHRRQGPGADDAEPEGDGGRPVGTFKNPSDCILECECTGIQRDHLLGKATKNPN